MAVIAIVGGTGPEGRGLALRFAMAGHRVILGSRDSARAAAAAQELLELRGGISVSGAVNAEAAEEAEWVVFSVPYDGLSAIVETMAPALGGKLVVSVVSPLVFNGGRPQAVEVPQGSAAQQVAALLPTSSVVAAFHHISAPDLLKPDRPIEADVIVCGDQDEARHQVMELAGQVAGLRGVDGGPLEGSR